MRLALILLCAVAVAFLLRFLVALVFELNPSPAKVEFGSDRRIGELIVISRGDRTWDASSDRRGRIAS